MDNQYLTIEEIRDGLEKAYRTSYTPDPNKFPRPKDGAVLNEEMSVRWNREEVKRLQEKYDSERKRLKEERNKKIRNAEQDIYCYISQETGLNKEKAEKLWNFAYNNHHAYLDDLFGWLEEYIELYNSLK